MVLTFYIQLFLSLPTTLHYLDEGFKALPQVLEAVYIISHSLEALIFYLESPQCLSFDA